MAPISAAAVPGKTASFTPFQGAAAPASLASQRGLPFTGSDMSSGVRPSQAFVDKTTPYTAAASAPDFSPTLHPVRTYDILYRGCTVSPLLRFPVNAGEAATTVA